MNRRSIPGLVLVARRLRATGEAGPQLCSGAGQRCGFGHFGAQQHLSGLLSFAWAFLLCLMVPALSSAAPRGDVLEFRIPRIEGTVKIDAVLDEAAWNEALVLEPNIETDPSENVAAPVKTECRLMYNVTHIFFSCHAFDPEPSKIRARLTDRDISTRSDDTVGLAVDPFNAQLGSFVFDINPFGVQNDRRYTELDRRSDASWDAIWDSAGRIVEDGYIVEAAIPFSSLRFPSTGEDQVWSFSVRRYYPRDVYHRISLTPFDRADSCRTCQNPLLIGFAGVDAGRSLEITPTLVGVSRRTTADDSGLAVDEPNKSAFDAGLTVSWGLRPNLLFSGTINPDFSQVEADEAQLDVNESFALFFPEKRPFFLEGEEYFGSQINAVYTRSVADPEYGLKLIGREGKNEIGVLYALDAATNILLPGIESSTLSTIANEATAGIVRYRRQIGEASTVGLLLSDRSAGNYGNSVVGLDTRLRLSSSDYLSVQVLASDTRYGGEVVDHDELGGESLTSTALAADYTHQTRIWRINAQYKDLGDDFRADLGFVPRVGFRQLEVEGERTWHGASDSWYNRFNVEGKVERTEQSNGERLDETARISAKYQGPLQSFLSAGGGVRNRTYAGVPFDGLPFFFANAFAVPNATWSGGIDLRYGGMVDVAGVRKGTELRVGPRFVFTPGRHLSSSLAHTLRRFELPGGRLFRADLTELRLVYQFSARAFVRAILQYQQIDRDASLYLTVVTSVEDALRSQFLFSYKVNARTAVYAGYTSAEEDLDGAGLSKVGDTAFFKIGYAWQP